MSAPRRRAVTAGSAEDLTPGGAPGGDTQFALAFPDSRATVDRV